MDQRSQTIQTTAHFAAAVIANAPEIVAGEPVVPGTCNLGTHFCSISPTALEIEVTRQLINRRLGGQKSLRPRSGRYVARIISARGDFDATYVNLN